MRHEEMRIQMAVVRYLRYKYPDILFTSIPAWGQSLKQGAKNKAMGLRKGWPDLFIAEPRSGFNGLFIELKSEKGRPTKEQEDIMAGLRAKKYYAVYSYSFDSCLKLIEYYLSGKEVES